MRICVIDDNDINLSLLRQIAGAVDGSAEIETFLSPQEAVARCREAPPDLVIVDFLMPGMNGHEVVTALRTGIAGADVPIVMVTASEERSVRQRALDLGVTDFIVKPIEPAEVKARLANLLALRRSHLKLMDRAQDLDQEVRRATRIIAERDEELIIRLSRAAEFRDPETGAHISRMAHFSRLIALELGLPEEWCDRILRAAPMHDVGKLGIPDGILLKAGPLDPAETEIMRRHARIGFSILGGSGSAVIRLGAEIALSHHEKFDGSGYPSGLQGEAIPLSGRIVAVVDVFDALTSARPYKAAWSLDRARRYLEDSRGSHFDPACVDAFLRVWPQVLAVRDRFADPLPESGLPQP